MSSAPVSPAQRLLKPVAALAALAIILMLVMSYWGGYTSKGGETESGDEASTEASASAESSETPDGEAAEEAEPESSAKVIVLIEGLNFRTAASRDAELIRGLGKDEVLTHLATQDGWYKVTDSDGKEGYVSSSEQYTRLEE